ncbi:hypothetical protein [Streptococcus pneumoniae]|uniref:hypothetical protein n=1 Tax=Streptococcus pneumoniae TaxID=1313 RepID=UPI001EFEB4A4|nr:hypothetical protein [Streptococcus pneumoniae]
MSTGKYIGEGFDLPQLDTLILAAPFSWKNNLIQYAGRIHRNYKDKSLVRIFDYVDIHVPYLEKMFQKRQVAYRKMDYRVIEGEEKQFVYVDRGLSRGKTGMSAYFTLCAPDKTDEFSKRI